MKKLLIILAITALMASCATIMNSPSQQISFQSTPAAAAIFDNGVRIGQTPMVAKLTRSAEHRIAIKLDGFKPYEITLTKGVNWGWGIVGNVLLTGFVGIVIDFVTGAIYKLEPNTVYANLLTNDVAFTGDNGGNLMISVVMNPDTTMEKIGQMER